MIIHLLTLANGDPHECTDTYVVEFDPTIHEPTEEYSGGHLRVTRDPAKAKQFETHGEAFEYLRQSHGTRPDGEPNRPLTAFHAVIE